MFKFFKSKKTEKATTFSDDSELASATQQRPPVGFHREIVRGVFGSMVRANGIPPNSLSFDVFPLRRLTGEKELHIQLIMLQWSERVLYHAPLLQQQMQADLGQYTAYSDISSFIVSWRFSSACVDAATRMANRNDVAPSEPQEPEEEITIFLERQFAPKPVPAPTLDASLFAPYKRVDNFAATQVDPLK
jgi:hypothetical protein